MAQQYIKIKGANEHNLKNIDVTLPRDKFIVLTGLSGSGKSSLAFDTIYAEGQRRYMESLSSYARQFLGQMEKPNVEKIEGLSPAISIDQKSTNRNPRSTVGTVTEIYDYFRLLYARIGIPHCPKCGKEIKKQTVDQMADQIMQLPERTKIQLLAPVVRGRKGTHQKLLDSIKRSGYVRVQIDGSVYELTEEISLDKNKKHNIEVVVDRLVVKEGIEKRLVDSIENVLELADGLMTVDVIGGEQIQFSQSFSCPDCGISIDEIEPRSFSFNNPFGACPECSGLGYKMEFGEIVPQPQEAEAVRSIYLQYLAGASFKQLAEQLQTEDVPYDEDKSWNKNMVARILEDDRYIGEKEFPALIPTEQFHAAQERRKEMRPEYKQTPAQKELRKLCGSTVPDSVARKVLKILNQMVDDPQIIKIETSGVPTTEDIRRLQQELDTLLQTPPVDADTARQKALEVASLKLASVKTEEYESHRLRRIFGSQAKLWELDANLLRQSIRKITYDSKTVKVLLKNNQVLEECDDT